MTPLSGYGHFVALGPDKEGKLKKPIGLDWQHTPSEPGPGQGRGFVPAYSVYVIDFDGNKDPNGSKMIDSMRLVSEFQGALCDDPLFYRLWRGYTEQSLSQGFHVVYRVQGEHQAPAKKLAYHSTGKTAVEMLSSGMQMAIGSGSSSKPADVTPAEHDRIVRSITSLCKAPPTVLTSGREFWNWMAACGYKEYDDIPSNSMSGDDELKSLVASMVAFGSYLEDITATWIRVADSADLSWPWTEEDFNRHYAGAERKFGADGVKRREEREREQEHFATRQAVAQSPVVTEQVAQEVLPPELLIPASFWAQHETLEYVRDAAWTGQSCPDAVLANLLAKYAAAAPFDMRLDTGIRTPASLNFFAAVCGEPGAGKTDAHARAELLLPKLHNAYTRESFGSGEGIAAAYMDYEYTDHPTEKNADGTPKKVRSKYKVQVRNNCFFFSDEGFGFITRMSRPESTLGERFRSAWMGEDLVDSNAKDENKRRVSNYCLGAVVGFQPRTIGAVVDEVHMGTAQRFLYVWASDPATPISHPAPRPVMLDLTRDPRLVTSVDGDGRTFSHRTQGDQNLTMHPSITEELKIAQWRVSQGNLPAPADSHRNLMRCKIAALLMLLFKEGTQVQPRHWELAGVILDTSDRVREHVRLLARKGRAAENRAKGADLATIETSKKLTVTLKERADTKVGELLMQGRSPSEIMRLLTKPQRTVFPDVQSIKDFRDECLAAE